MIRISCMGVILLLRRNMCYLVSRIRFKVLRVLFNINDKVVMCSECYLVLLIKFLCVRFVI